MSKPLEVVVAEKKIRVVAKRNGNKSKLEAVDQVPATAAKKEYIEPPIAPDAVPFKPEPKNEAIKSILPEYIMVCQAGEYRSNSWIGLGWAILTHRLWHLWKHGSFMD